MSAPTTATLVGIIRHFYLPHMDPRNKWQHKVDITVHGSISILSLLRRDPDEGWHETRYCHGEFDVDTLLPFVKAPERLMELLDFHMTSHRMEMEWQEKARCYHTISFGSGGGVLWLADETIHHVQSHGGPHFRFKWNREPRWWE